MPDSSKIKWFLLWPVISCTVPLVFLLVSIIANVPEDAPEQLVSLIGGLMYLALFVFVPPSVMFWGYAIYFDWCRHRVARQKLSKRCASISLAVVALFLGGIALLFRGALLSSWVTFVEGPLAFGLLPAIVAVYRIARTGVDLQPLETQFAQSDSGVS